jgi:hypothetical protein
MLDAVAPDHFADARSFFEVPTEAEGLAIAGRLRARYVITMFFPGIRRGTLGALLQHGDGLGAGEGQEPLGHFRLITEGPPGGTPLSDLFGMRRPDHVVPYKLFEIVEGAVLEVGAGPGEEVTASLVLRTPLSRRIDYVARARAGGDGIAHLRVPYSTDRTAPVRALRPWRVEVDGTEHRVEVSEAEVRGGRTIRVLVADAGWAS